MMVMAAAWTLVRWWEENRCSQWLGQFSRWWTETQRQLECLSSTVLLTKIENVRKIRKDPKFCLEYAEISKRKLQAGRLIFPEYDPEEMQHSLHGSSTLCINTMSVCLYWDTRDNRKLHVRTWSPEINNFPLVFAFDTQVSFTLTLLPDTGRWHLCVLILLSARYIPSLCWLILLENIHCGGALVEQTFFECFSASLFVVNNGIYCKEHAWN